MISDIGIFARRYKYKPSNASIILSHAIKGFNHIGITDIRDLNKDNGPCYVAAVHNIPKRRFKRRDYKDHKNVCEQQNKDNHKILAFEQGYFNRSQYKSVGWNSCHGFADFRNINMPPDRWKLLEGKGFVLRDWQTKGDNILLCGQVSWDASVQHINYQEWIDKTVIEIRKNTNRPIVFRPHPNRPESVRCPKGVRVSEFWRPISEDLSRSWATVSYNSTCACDSLLHGVPAFVCDNRSMSVAYPIANKNLADLENPERPNREQWLYNLCYAQWSIEEIEKGEPFNHLQLKEEIDDMSKEDRRKERRQRKRRKLVKVKKERIKARRLFGNGLVAKDPICDVVIYKKKWYKNRTPMFSAVLQGLKNLGIDHRVTVHQYIPARVAIFFVGRRNYVFHNQIMDYQRKAGNTWINIEGGFMKRPVSAKKMRTWKSIERFHFGIGWKGIGGRGHYLNKDMPSDRFEKLEIDIKPWRIRLGGPSILCGQVPSDASLGNDYRSKMSEFCDDLLARTSPVLYRPHPRATNFVPNDAVPIDTLPLKESLDRAYAVASYNSTVLVDAAITGVPVFSLGRYSVTEPVANTSLDTINCPIMPERYKWLCDLAYAQWNVNEVAQGLPFEHLKVKEVLKGLQLRDLEENL